MQTEDELLKCRKVVDDAVHENFGYCPDYPWFDKALERMRMFEAAVRRQDPAAYEVYQNKYY